MRRTVCECGLQDEFQMSQKYKAQDEKSEQEEMAEMAELEARMHRLFGDKRPKVTPGDTSVTNGIENNQSFPVSNRMPAWICFVFRGLVIHGSTERTDCWRETRSGTIVGTNKDLFCHRCDDHR